MTDALGPLEAFGGVLLGLVILLALGAIWRVWRG